ncbi:MAG TPA: alkaline phosphatase family protein [Ktedonobacteraceae bacterium]|nr:alkaline phosphatase family protein [Ktedonobacteraceae bacterium]
MLNATSLNAVNSSRFSQRFVKPLYSSYCFANLPATMQYLLTGHGQSALPMDVFGSLPTRYNKVVLIFLDAFGWRFFGQFADHFPLLKMFLQQGVVSKLTSQFPSATAAHVTCINTGLNTAQSGVYEWYYYEPLVDAIISPLRFSYAGDSQQNTLKASGIPPEAFYPSRTIHQSLHNLGVQSHVFQPAANAHSSYSNVVFKGTTSRNPFRALEQALDQLTARVLAKEESPAFYLLYYDIIDTTSHLSGPGSQALAEELEYFFLALEQRFYRKLRQLTGDTLLIITADHGQTEVSPQTTCYLNRAIPDIARYLRVNQAGTPIAPAGSARDMFLYVKEELLDEAIERFRRALAGRAEVYATQDLIAQNLFGSPKPSPAFLSRIGNVAILPHEHETVWWFEQGRFVMHFQGHHGGLTPDEMEIPLLLLPL